MIIKSIKTPVVHPKDNLLKIITSAIPKLRPKSILAISSKIIALSEGNLRSKDKISKRDLIIEQADAYIAPIRPESTTYITIKYNILAINAGIDESNSPTNEYILLPQSPQVSLNKLWKQIKAHYKVDHVGLLMTDSTTLPLQWGVRGVAVAHCGFLALNNYIGKPDIFGRKLKMTKVNIAQGLAAAAVLEMGETNEQKPLALISDLQNITFQNNPPSDEELKAFQIDSKYDLYAPILQTANWKRKISLS